MLATVIPRGGSAFKAPPPPAVLFGKASTVITDNEREFKTRFKIIESADIIPSHFLQGIDVVINPSYPADLQPRQRDNRLIMRINAVKMADNLRPADLLYSRNLNQGAPVVRNDNVILNGNGRAMALIYAYSKGKANNYRQALIDNAAQFGFIPAQIAKFKAPVLVRKITSPLTDNDIKSIIFSTDGGAKLSPSEQAKTDAEKITPEIFGYYEPNDDGEIGNASNHIFCAAVLNAVCTQNEINGYTCNNATINTDGLLRVKRAVFSAAYNDNNELLLLMTESANNNIKTIGNALFNVAPNVAKLNYRMKAKSAYSYPLAKTLADAAQKISALRQDNQKVQTYLNENSLMPGFDLPVETKIVIAILDANKNSCKAITEFINALISAIDNQGSPSQASLFAFDPEPFLKIIKSAAKDFISSDLLPRGLDNTPAPAKATTPAPAPAKAVDAVKINTADKKIAQEIKPAPQKNSKEITPPAPVIPANNDTIYFSYIASNSKSVTPMFKFGNGATLGVKSAYAELKKRKINLETSYRLLIDAIIYGKAKISADQFGDKNLFWNENLTDKYAAGITPATSNYYSIRNINIVASYAAGLPFAPQFCGTWFKYTKKEIVAKFDAAKLGAPAPAKVSMPLPAKVSTPAPAKVSTPLPENVSTPSPVDNLIKFQPGQFYWNINGYNENQTPDYIVVLSRVGNTVTVQRVSQDGICKDKPFRYRVKISKFGDSFCECVNTFFGYFHSNHLISPNSDKEYIAMTPADIIPVIDDVTFYKVIANAAIIQTACFGFLVLYRSLFLHINMLPFCIETPDYTITIGNSPDELDPSDAVSPELLYALISVFAQFPPPSIFIQWFFLTMKIFPESQDLINARQEKENSEFWKRANLESRAMQRLEQRKQDKLDAE